MVWDVLESLELTLVNFHQEGIAVVYKHDRMNEHANFVAASTVRNDRI